MLCDRAPYFNKKDYLTKVPAEVINSTAKTVHEAIRPKLAEQWKAWAAKNHEILKQISDASASDAPAMAAADNEMLADIFGRRS